MKRLLITGATGDLGHSLVDFLKSQYQILALIRPSSDDFRLRPLGAEIYRSLQDLPSEVDWVIDTVTCYGRSGESAETLDQVNVRRALDLVAWAQAHQVKKMIFADTCLPPEASPYAASKAELRHELKTLAPSSSSSSLALISLRMEHFYGEVERPHKFLSWLMHQLLLETGPIPLSSGQQRRNFIHILDVCRAFETLLRAPLPGGAQEFQIGASEVWPLREIIDYLAKKTQQRPDRLLYGAVKERASDHAIPELDLGGMRNLGWEPKVNLQQGLDSLVAKFYDKYGKVKGGV